MIFVFGGVAMVWHGVAWRCLAWRSVAFGNQHWPIGQRTQDWSTTQRLYKDQQSTTHNGSPTNIIQNFRMHLLQRKERKNEEKKSHLRTAFFPIQIHEHHTSPHALHISFEI